MVTGGRRESSSSTCGFLLSTLPRCWVRCGCFVHDQFAATSGDRADGRLGMVRSTCPSTEAGGRCCRRTNHSSCQTGALDQITLPGRSKMEGRITSFERGLYFHDFFASNFLSETGHFDSKAEAGWAAFLLG
ncbi:hypothetical protein GQ55_9G632700 [Panicum hallii var. hallii]|uniref:Uncharacterized protein n=1 Tax=Panicum hallii var. hallii TaxID=1504633 RepID=A0A2T7CI98_9POAL|nr:hypothetical protein GQ55_9G632700 [Panicum hallii var. hallii]